MYYIKIITKTLKKTTTEYNCCKVDFISANIFKTLTLKCWT